VHPQRQRPFSLDPRRQRDSGVHCDDLRTGVFRHEVLPTLGGSCHLCRRKGKTILPHRKMGRTSLRRCRLARPSPQDISDVAEREYLNERRKLCSRGELSALPFIDRCDICDRHACIPRQEGDDSPLIWQLGVCSHTEVLDPGFSFRLQGQYSGVCATARLPHDSSFRAYTMRTWGSKEAVASNAARN